MLMSGLRMLHGSARVLLALRMVALAVMFGSRAMSLRRVLVMLGSLIVLVLSHFCLFGEFAP